MFLNDGIDPVSNKTILPRSVIEETTEAYSIALGSPMDATSSIAGYGMGWVRSSYKGHDVSHLYSLIIDEYQYCLVDISQWRHPGFLITRDFPTNRWVRDCGTHKHR